MKQSGTCWYRGHSRFQGQTGRYGAIVVEPRRGERFPTARDHVVRLSDRSDETPDTAFANLKKLSDFYNLAESTVADHLRDASQFGVRQALAKRTLWNRLRMSPTDLSDGNGHA